MPSFASLTRTQKRDLILAESHTTSAQITLSPSAIDTLLAALAQTPNHQLDAYSYSRASSAHIINENWGVDVASFPALHHQRDFRPESWDARLLAVLAILSEYTQGQGVYMGSLVCYAVEFRVGNGRRDRDLFVNIGDVIRRVIRDLLQPLREEDAEEIRAARERKAEYDGRKKGWVKRKRGEEEEVNDDDDDDDEMESWC